jgi:colanic acid/amylovoran biosynthesis protein
MTKIFIDGDRFPVSVGSQEMMICTMKILKRYIPDAKFIILSFYPEFDHELYDIYNFDLKVVKRSKSELGLILDLLKECKKADVIVCVYGDAFLGKDTITNIKFLFKLLIIIFAKRPVILFPLSVGPFNTKLSKFLVRIVFNRVKSITLREEISKNCLEEADVKKPSIYLTGDTAFVLEPAPRERVNEIFLKEGINKNNRLLIGINISQLLSYKSKTQNVKQDYIELMAKTADYIVSNLNATVIFVSHEIHPEGMELVGDVTYLGGDDITAVKDAFTKVKNKNNIMPITNKYIASELKGIIGECDLFIGARTHSTIASTSMCVPTIAIEYSHKAPGIMRMIGLEKYVCNFATMDFEELKSKINDMWSNKEKIKKDLESKVDALKESAWSNGKMVKNLLDSLNMP